MGTARQNILALDLGTRCGWALGSPPSPVLSGIADFSVKRHESASVRWTRFIRFLGDLASEEAPPIDHVVYEIVARHNGTHAAHVYGGFVAELQTWCASREVSYEGFSVGRIKKFWTGNGNADKAAMIAAAHYRGFSHVKDDNEADAIALLHLARAEAMQ